MLNTSTFNREEVESFLQLTGNNFAACCFYNDMPERPEYIAVANWFRRHFASSNTAQYLFRLAEAHCTQTSTTINE